MKQKNRGRKTDHISVHKTGISRKAVSGISALVASSLAIAAVCGSGYGHTTAEQTSTAEQKQITLAELDALGSSQEDGNALFYSYFLAEEVLLAPNTSYQAFLSQDSLSGSAVNGAVGAAAVVKQQEAAKKAAQAYAKSAEITARAEEKAEELKAAAAAKVAAKAAEEAKAAAEAKAAEEAAKAEAEAKAAEEAAKAEAEAKAAEEAAKAEAEEKAKTSVTASYTSSVSGISDEDYSNLLRIVEAEAEDQGMTGKILVANVVINRMKNSEFPNTITGVIFQKGQFSPVSNGRFDRVTIAQSTVEAVDRALSGEDYSEGALYFVHYKSAKGWFNTLNYLFQYGDHVFYK